MIGDASWHADSAVQRCPARLQRSGGLYPWARAKEPSAISLTLRGSGRGP